MDQETFLDFGAMSIYEMLDKKEEATEKEKLEMERELLSRVLYYEGD